MSMKSQKIAYAEHDAFWLDNWRFSNRANRRPFCSDWVSSDNPDVVEWDTLRFALRTEYGDWNLAAVPITCEGGRKLYEKVVKNLEDNLDGI